VQVEDVNTVSEDYSDNICKKNSMMQELMDEFVQDLTAETVPWQPDASAVDQLVALGR
jgi:hypothetical protein